MRRNSCCAGETHATMCSSRKIPTELENVHTRKGRNGMRYLQTLIASFIIRTGNLCTPPRRESRLHKAVLTLLVAASAAFFVCAQASSATFIPDDDPGNNIGAVKAITNVTIWHTSNVVAGEQFTLTASTDQPFHTVEWFLGESEVPIATATSDYEGDQYASRDYTFQSGQGSSDEAGRRHAIKAVAYPLEPDDPRNNGLTATSDERPVFVHEGKGKLLY